MTKELFVSSTPHETKVGLVEDDQLAEVFIERENEYTLAGSIYKGRVTRVLPGMQSAFVDVGLERDAFLYVSDFMELEDHDEDLSDVVPVSRGIQDLASPGQNQSATTAEIAAAPAVSAGPSFVIESEPLEEEEPSQTEPTHAETAEHSTAAPEEGNAPAREPREWRGRRRRRGRRGERGLPESRFSRPAQDNAPAIRSQERPDRSTRSEYGPPPGYQPMILPGESISKYQRFQNAASAGAPSGAPSMSREEPQSMAASQVFADDEPMFASPRPFSSEGSGAAAGHPVAEPETGPAAENDHWDRAELRAASQTSPLRHDPAEEHYEEMQVIGDIGADEGDAQEDDFEEVTEAPTQDLKRSQNNSSEPAFASPGTIEEEEIEEEEADLASYVEEIEQDAHFEELEEETQAADGNGHLEEHALAASSESASSEAPEAPAIEAASPEDQATEAVEEEDEEAELEEAQAEAEALLDAEARGNGTVEARAEVRAPSGSAGYQQRARRPGFDRRGRGGRRGGGGGARRFRPRRELQNQATPLISDLLKEGQEILVQIAKEPIGKKGARITSHIALPGRFLVYMPTVNHTGVSRKIASEEERQRLKRIVLSERENGHGGFIVRTAAQGAAEEELRADIRFLKGLWNEIKTRAENGKAPALIYHDLNVVERVLRDQVTSDFSQIWVDTEQEYERIVRFANRFQPALVRRVKLYSKETPLFEQFGLSEEINKGLKSKVWLKSGGYIVINQTEALVAIDINTGKYVGKTSRLEDTIVKTNVDAIREIVRQIRLRDLGGIIVIDFIDMDERRNRQKVMQALEEALRSDRAPSKVLQFNDFGLVAITRKRVKQSLERTIGTPCPYCTATGYVKSVTTVCNEIYTEMRKISKHLEHSDVMLRVNPEVAKSLKTNNGKWLIEMEELTSKSIIVKSDPALHQEQFDIN
jgi:Rne/Rng family ribonuclease